MYIATLIYPHQLFAEHRLLSKQQPVYLVEEPLLFSQYRFHRQKLMLHRASLKRYQEQLTKKKYDVRYIDLGDLAQSQSLGKRLAKDGIQKIQVYDPEDDYLRRGLVKSCQDHGIILEIKPDPNFLTPLEVIDIFVEGREKLFFAQFYIEQRKRLGVLLEPGFSPRGGKWSFDADNRKKLPKGHVLPKIAFAKPDKFCDEARAYVKRAFPNALGDDQPLIFPSGRKEALAWLDNFNAYRLSMFGDYEDAIAQDETILYHSCLTPTLNVGLISPQEIVDRTLACEGKVPLNALEGFIRQVIGWREFVRLVYRHHGVRQRTTNFWQHRRALPASFYNGTTGIEPVDTVINRLLMTGYCHHIERLMILGNFMLLCEFDPDAIYRWFMEFFVDAYDWVMVPNVYGMSQYADGGLMTTKPYISGSSYILRMSDFKRGPWCDVWDALYWRFVDRHRVFFEKNPRMSVMTKQLDRMGDKLKEHRRRADQFLNGL